ncbi:zinc finger protein 488 [Lampetra fluviatilis]
MDMMYSVGYRCSHYAGMFRLDCPPAHDPRAPPCGVRLAPQPWLTPLRDSNPVCLASPSAAPCAAPAARKCTVDFHNLARDLESRPALSESAMQGHIARDTSSDAHGRLLCSAAVEGPRSAHGVARPKAQRGLQRGEQREEQAWKRERKVEKVETSSPDDGAHYSARPTHAVWMNNINNGSSSSSIARGERSERRTPSRAGEPNPLDTSRGDVFETPKSVVGGQHKSAFSPPAKSEHRRSTSSQFMVSELLKTTTASAHFGVRGIAATAAATAAAAHNGPTFVYADCRASWSKPLVPRPILRPSPPLPMPQVAGPGGLGLPPQNWCAKCNVSFRLTSDLVYHMRSHHRCERSAEPLSKRRREERLRCQVCGESFRERHHLSRHMISHN